MLSEYAYDKKSLISALERADASLHENTSVYALLETDDPGWPFEVRLVCGKGQESADMKLIDERLFDRAFLDFGYHEVRDEKNLEGVAYAPIEELLANPDCIGVAPIEFFDADASRARMAHGMDEDDEQDLDTPRFVRFLKLARETVFEGVACDELQSDDLERICGLLFRYDTHAQGDASCVMAFQRVQPMWVQKKSSLLVFGAEGQVQAFSGRSLKVGNNFDFVIFDGKILFRNLRALEILFKYRKIVAQCAKDYADTFDGILADFEKIDERIEKSRAVANRLLKLQREGSPVANLDAQELQYRVNRIGYYSRKIKFNEEGKVMLTTDTNVSDFIRLLGDTFLVSPVSDARYEARTKKLLDSDEE